VIVGGLVAALILGIFLLPVLYVSVAREQDSLPEPDTADE
jgi:cobalt-zinc-cadmium resistance protein CzcA